MNVFPINVTACIPAILVVVTHINVFCSFTRNITIIEFILNIVYQQYIMRF